MMTRDLNEVLPPGGFSRRRKVLELIPWSSATLHRKVAAGEFPRPVALSEGCTAWRNDELRPWIESRPPIPTRPHRKGASTHEKAA
ncbi:MAG: AlpA family phage regulatory protein [Candidatus Competibacteraceae bacterium]|nr:AlpA family phage regulatory protein [Candidatus Competibacteraceae bacterium]